MTAIPPLVREPDAGTRPRVLAMANQKGGVGKTTTAINLGTALAAIGERVLILDLDPQGNASTGLGINRNARVDFELRDAGRRETPARRGHSDLGAAPAYRALDHGSARASSSKSPAHDDRAYKLRNALRATAPRTPRIPNASPTSWSIVRRRSTCSPSTRLAAADAVVVPLQCEFFALEGLSQLLTTVEQVRSTLNPSLTIHGVVLTMYDPRNSLAGQVVADVRAYMGDKVYETVIPRNVRLSEAPSHGKPALLYDLKCAGSQAYLKLASEVIRREGRWRAA